MIPRFIEQAVLFGQSMSLVGVVSRPLPKVAVRKPAVLILNTGIVHRVGHHRMYVTMARELAAMGHVSFRFDFSGLGDSASWEGDLAPLQAWQKDLSEALDWLVDTYNLDEVVLIGLCSGADIALSYGHKDKRVVGLVLLDPTIPPTTRFYAHYIRRRLSEFRSWWSFVRGRGRIWREITDQLRLAFGSAPEHPRSPNDPRMRSDLEQMYLKSLDRNLQMLCVLTGGPWEGRQSYREQLFDAFPNVPLKDRVSLEHFSDADHTFTSQTARARLLELVLGWIKTIPSSESTGVSSTQQEPRLRMDSINPVGVCSRPRDAAISQ
jgi:pimeloyl-ACP methyl ester carboxylesterase